MSAEIWNQVLSQISNSVSKSEYSTWFSRITFGEEKDGKVTLYVPSKFVLDRVVSDYKSLMENKFSELGQNVTLNFVVNNKKSNNTTENKTQNAPESNVKEIAKNPTLNPAYTFDAFVPGDNSNFAYNACLAISKNPGSAYNPCLIYGGVGLGKTHLIQSIGNAICAENPKAKIMYVTAENFINEFIRSISENTTHQFKNKYRKVSVLLIDDIQILQGKNGAQEELFNTFNDLYDTGRQLVFTCDRPVEELKDITDRLRSRFTRGLNIDIQPPNYETRVAIIQKKCLLQNFSLSKEVVEFIAKNISSNVRMLESCITKLQAYSKLLHQDISLETAKEQLKQNIFSSNDTSGITIESILKTVSSYFGITVFDLKGKTKNQSVVKARQVAMYLCSKLTDNSTTQIAQEFGGKNHSTVVYTVKKLEGLMCSSENDLSNIVNKLSDKIKEEAKK